MELYIEYAFLENFLFDGALPCLALYASKIKIKWWKVCLSGTIGALFALLFPLLRLPDFLKIILKLTVGALLCLVTAERLKTRKEWGRYALTCILVIAGAVAFSWGVKKVERIPIKNLNV